MKAKLGSGSRFKALKKKISSRKGFKPRGGGSKAEAAGAIAAAIGRKKYGKSRFQKLAAAGRKRKRK